MNKRIEKLKTPEQCVIFARNAANKNRPDLAEQARKRAVKLRADSLGAESEAENEALQAVFAYEEVLTKKRGKKTRATRTWQMIDRPGQPTLGAGILSLNRHAGKFSDVTAEEMLDLADLVGALEGAVQSAFDHRIMNYLMLMMVDHHVHYHVILRYECARTFAGREWVDNGWPALPVIADSQHSDDPGLLSLIQERLIAV